ncbi:hypothetical protein NFI96_012663, partial [Prochilodus magdalenae]
MYVCLCPSRSRGAGEGLLTSENNLLNNDKLVLDDYSDSCLRALMTMVIRLKVLVQFLTDYAVSVVENNYKLLGANPHFILNFKLGFHVPGGQFNNQTVLQNPDGDQLYPGDNVTLSCIVEMVESSCPEPHGVYWFKDGSVQTHSAVSNTGNTGTQEIGDGQCEQISSADSSTQSCVYKLPKRNLGLSDAGTYYCAVLRCGEIIFGNGTKLIIADNNSSATVSPTYLLLVSSNVISVLVMITIIVIRFKKPTVSTGK